MTRALFALFRLDLTAAYEMHPLVFLMPLAVIIYFSRRLIPKRIMKALCVSALVLLLSVYIVRMNGQNSVVYADFESGLIYKIIHNIF